MGEIEPLNQVVVEIVPEFKVISWWPDLERILDGNPKLWEGWTTKNEMLEDLEEGMLQLWTVEEDNRIRFFAITQVVKGGIGSVRIVWAAGELSDISIVALKSSMGKFALMTGVGQIEIVGRQGWIRRLAKFGFKLVYVAVACDVRRA